MKGQRFHAHLVVAMAVGQACLAILFSWIASRSSLSELEDYRTKVELPLWFAILPALTTIVITIHVWTSRHVDRACPWISLGWIILTVNIVALMLFMQMTR